jgi:carbon monoxide dehydrogenase subunit G
MSTLKIEERITVAAPPARVWTFLLDPARVASCLPGAKLDGVDGERTFLGTMKIKVGPVQMEMKGKATLAEVDEAAHRVTMTGTGNDRSGGGSAKMDMKSQILPLEGGGSEIIVVADVDVTGKLVRFGRGMMEGISRQLFKQFAERVRAELASEGEDEEEDEAPPAEAAPAEAKPAETAPAPKEEAPKEEAAKEEAAPAQVDAQEEAAPAQVDAKEEAAPAQVDAKEEAAPAPVEATEETASAPADAAPVPAAAPPDVAPAAEDATPAPDELPPAAEEAKAEAPTAKEEARPEAPEEKAAPAPRPPAKQKTRKAAPLAVKPREDEALDAGGLLWAALWAWLKGLFGRVLGKRG